MLTFHNPSEAAHAPAFFLVRGAVRQNFEIPARAAALRAALGGMGLAPIVAPEAGRAALLTVHDAAYLDFLEHAHADWAALADAGPEVVANIHPSPEMLAQGAAPGPHIVNRAGWFTADAACPIGPGTWGASIGAAGAALAAAAETAAGRHAYALCRPPGHHTYAARAGGHCFLNNAALAVEHLRAAGAARVAVLDIDSHHGNGTQGIFWDRADVLTVSLHADPDRYYPWFVGHARETGGALHSNLNLAQPMGTGDGPWLAALAIGIAAIRAFGAEALVVPLGFDASEHEPLAALRVTADGFARAGAAIRSLGLPTCITQEGGYNVDVIGGLLTRFLTGFGG